MKTQTYRTLLHYNPWLIDSSAFRQGAAKYLPERWVQRDLPLSSTAPAHVLIGARQVGKSSLIWNELITKGSAPLFVTAYEPSIQAWASSAAEVAADLSTLIPDNTPLFFEEAQRLPDAGLLIKGLVDLRVPYPIIATGSSAFHLHARHKESLAGRASRAVLRPQSQDRSLIGRAIFFAGPALPASADRWEPRGARAVEGTGSFSTSGCG